MITVRLASQTKTLVFPGSLQGSPSTVAAIQVCSAVGAIGDSAATVSASGAITCAAVVIGPSDPGGSEIVRVGGAGRFSGALCVRNAAAVAALAVLTDSETAPNNISGWSTKHTILAGPASGSYAPALACSLNHSNGESSIIALTPSVQWGDLALRAAMVSVYLVGSTTAAIQADNSSTADDTRFLLYDVTAGALKRVTRGAADSAGTGYRTLRIAN